MGSDVNVGNREDLTPLIDACRTGNIALVAFLIQNGAAINHRDRCGRTALWYALIGGTGTVAELLIAKGGVTFEQQSS